MRVKNIVYMIGTYPLLTTTFIDREIMKLKQLGVNLRIFSIRKPPNESPLSSFQLEIIEQVNYLLPVNVITLLISHLYFAILHPVRFFRTFAYLVTRHHPDLKTRLKSILHFSEGVYFSYFLRGQDIEEVHSHFLDRAATLALVAKKLLEVPYSISIHAGADIYVDPVLIREKLHEARQAVTCTHHNKKHLESIVGPDLVEKITVVSHGVNPLDFEPNLDPKHEMMILSVGQLKMRKGFLDLIEACKILRDHNFNFQCEIVGSGPQFQILNEKIIEYSLEDKVKLCGALPNEMVMEKYKRASLFVLPCKVSENGDVDGIPNVLLESMVMNVPVISSTISAIPELITDQKNGLLIDPDDPEQLFKVIASLINSPQKRIDLGAEGRKTVLTHFDIEQNIEKLTKTLWPDLMLSAK